MMNIFATSLLFAMVFNLAMFIVAFKRATDRLTDISYALTFAALALFAVSQSYKESLHYLVSAMVLVWAIRLGGFLLYRVTKKGKDVRFDEMRSNFWKFLRFWFFQGLTVWVLMIPVIALSQGATKITALSIVGCVVWLVGLLIESIADFQKFAFNQNPQNKDAWIDQGIWKYSRHPNYFGEILVWVGLYLVIVPSLTNLGAIISLVSPLYIIILLLFVSGIPLLEKSADKKWGTNKAYLDYKRTTSVLIPMPKLIASLLLSFSAAAIGSLATTANIPTWYASLDKPFFNPPNWVFGPVWTILYTLMGISLYLVWTSSTKRPRQTAYILFGCQLVLNTLWSLVFFGLHSPEAGLVIILALIASVIYTIKTFRLHSRLAANLLLPYLAWISFAASLNLAIAVLN